MLLQKIVLENYGLYRGKNEFDLAPKKEKDSDKSKPIILFGGKNGAGKTTLLDAVRLTLYGRQSLGVKITTKKYFDYLDGKIHRSRDEFAQRQWARVSIEFDYVTQGEQTRYYVERCWRRLPEGGIKENLTIRKNNQEVNDIEAKHWEAFAASIVPERLSQLFFFDGEKIKTMAEDISGSTAVKEAINSLLGLDMVDRLKVDLNLYQSREAKKFGTKESKKLLEQTELQIEKIEDEIADFRNTYIDKEEALECLNEEIQKIENELHAAGSAYADQRFSEQQKHFVCETEIEIISKQLRIECEGLLPLALCPNISKLLIEQLKAETTIKEHSTIASAITKMSDELKENIAKLKELDNSSAKITQELIDKIAKKQTVLPEKLSGFSIIHNISDQSSLRIQDWIKGTKKSGLRLKKMTARLERLHFKQQNSSLVLERAPDQESLQPIVERLNKVNNLAGSIKADQISINAGIHQLEIKKNDLEREQKKLESKILAHQNFTHQTALIKTAQKALNAYKERLTKLKINDLEQTVADCFNLLVRKEDVLHGININPKTFKVTLLDRSGKSIPKEELSSGEKQIYAISILWGLAKTSGRPLPVIIDTPLGRLDSDHRRNLIQNYFPNAGHQVILLSTDTEVDENLYTDLQPYISHCFHLKYDDKERYTSFKQEYFWKEKKNA